MVNIFNAHVIEKIAVVTFSVIYYEGKEENVQLWRSEIFSVSPHSNSTLMQLLQCPKLLWFVVE